MFTFYENFDQENWTISTVTTIKEIRLFPLIRLEKGIYWMTFSSNLLVFQDCTFPFHHVFINILVAFSVLDFHH